MCASRLFSMFLCLVLASLSSLVHADFVSDEDLWVTDSGQFRVVRDGWSAGGAANAIEGEYDADTQVVVLSSDYLPATMWGSENPNAAFAFAAILTEFFGEFVGGTYALFAGPTGLPEIGLGPGQLMLQGEVLEFESQFVPCEEGSDFVEIPCDLYGENTQLYLQEVQHMPALLSVDFAAPELGLDADFLTFFPYLNPAFGVETTFWAESFDNVSVALGYLLVATVMVPDPAILLDQLGTAVADLGPGNSFADKVELVQTYLAVPDTQAACGVLGAFLNQVAAQRGKKLAIELADQLTEDALAVIDAIGCE